MNKLHYPDIERCKKLTEIGFPQTKWIALITDYGYEDGDRFTAWNGFWLCPSVMELLDVIYWKWIKYKADEKDDKDNWASLYVHIEQADLWYIVSLRWHSKEFGREMKFWKTHCWKAIEWLPNALCDLIFWLVENKYLTFASK